MTLYEAQQWLEGNRSMINVVPDYPLETWNVRIAQADAAMMQTAYWVSKAYKEQLVFGEKSK
jgi:hypothetical protein